MALDAGDLGVGSGQWELGLAVVEGRTGPVGCAVAGSARRGEAGRHMRRTLGVIEIGLMAPDAVRGQGRVVIVDVASRTGDLGVGAGQWEFGLAVIEGSPGPGRRVMALRAGGREADGRVRRTVRFIEVSLVASVAARRQRAGVVVVHVTGCAGHGHVRAGQRKFRGVVIERGPSPARRGVAKRAIGRESAGNVGRVRGSVEVGLMAGNASGRRVAVVVVGMALRTGHGGVFAGQRVMRVDRVIELGIQPICGGVTDRAVARQAELHVRRIVAVVEVRTVAGVARCQGVLEDVIEVAGGTGEGGMRAGQRIAGVFQVIKLGVEPAVHTVAAFARGGEAKPRMIEDRSEKVLLVAGVARG